MQYKEREHKPMSKIGAYVNFIARPGERDVLVEHLLAAAGLVSPPAGCELYIINISPSEPDTVWVTEIWRSQADRDAPSPPRAPAAPSSRCSRSLPRPLSASTYSPSPARASPTRSAARCDIHPITLVSAPLAIVPP